MKKFNWNEFKKENNKIAVHCKTQKESDDFLKMCFENGIQYDGESSKWFEFYGNKTIYLFYCGFGYAGLDYWKGRYTILEWSDYMGIKPKELLKNGYIVEQRDGTRKTVLLGIDTDFTGINNDVAVRFHNNIIVREWDTFGSWDENLIYVGCDGESKDIIKIIKPNHPYQIFDNYYKCGTEKEEIIWERKEEPTKDEQIKQMLEDYKESQSKSTDELLKMIKEKLEENQK